MHPLENTGVRLRSGRVYHEEKKKTARWTDGQTDTLIATHRCPTADRVITRPSDVADNDTYSTSADSEDGCVSEASGCR